MRTCKMQMGHTTHPWETEEVGVTVRATLGPIDFVQMLQWEFQLRREGFDSTTQFAFSQRRQLVEQRLDDGGIKDDHNHLE